MSDEEDVLLQALRALPRPATSARDGGGARAAFVRAASGRAWWPDLSRFAVPTVLAGVVGVYLSWAISTVNALAN